MTKDVFPWRTGASGKDFATRALICSYFLALGTGLIQGAELQRLTAPVLPDALAQPVASLFMICLAGLVLMDVQRRAAALLLALSVFWASYLTLIHGSGPLAAFWRDIALVAALLMTAGRTQNDDARVSVATPARRPTAPSRRARPDPAPYRQDFDLIRSS